MTRVYETLLERIRDMGRLDAVEALLDWDQQVMQPPKAVEARAQMLALVASVKHERRTSSELADLLKQAGEGGDDIIARTNIREIRRMHERAVCLPADLVREIAHTTAVAQSVWAKARKDSNFAAFAPHLSKIIDLKRREADCIGYESEPYDALLDEFEPGARTADVAELFARLRDKLTPLVRELGAAPRQPDVNICRRQFPRDAQEQFARRVAASFGYDFEAGRLDVSTHPFCMSMSSRDVRITTRYDEKYPASSLFSVMHEVGHALYEQGLPFEHAFTPAGAACSLGIHESQSRLWENMVGRSRPFWEGNYSLARELFPEALGGVGLDDFYAAINAVQPSLIRVEADEVTYNLHIILRFEMERELISGRLAVADVPRVWNEKMQHIVGISPPDDARGCLQDIHWSIGAFGYVATYALGNLYAGQFLGAIRTSLPNLDDSIRAGDFAPLLGWLRENIHRHGMCFRAGELCERVTGRTLSTEPLISYLQGKYRPIYGLGDR